MMKHALSLAVVSIVLGCQPGPTAEASPSTEPAVKTEKEALTKEPVVSNEQTDLSTKVLDLAPWKDKASWTYQLEVVRSEPGKEPSAGQAEMSMIVNKLAAADQGSTATIEVKNPADRELIVWKSSPEGIFQTEAKDGKSKFEPPMPLVPPTLKAGEIVIWKGKGQRIDGSTGDFEVRVKVTGEEEVDTEMGRMKAWAIESKAAWEKDGKPILSETHTWWSPGVGMVRMTREMLGPEYAQKLVLRLKNHTVK